MDQKTTTLLVLGVTVAIVASLAIAPIVGEMAYADTSNGGLGSNGALGHTSIIATCNAHGCTASATALTSGGGGGGEGGGPGGGLGGAGSPGGRGVTTSAFTGGGGSCQTCG
jgi:hypothetical protein